MNTVVFVSCAYALPKSAWRALKNAYRTQKEIALKRFLPERLSGCVEGVFKLRGPMDAQAALSLQTAFDSFRQPAYRFDAKSYRDPMPSEGDTLPDYVPQGLWIHFRHRCKHYVWPTREQILKDDDHELSHVCLWTESELSEYAEFRQAVSEHGSLHEELCAYIEDRAYALVEDSYEGQWGEFTRDDLREIVFDRSTINKARQLSSQKEHVRSLDLYDQFSDILSSYNNMGLSTLASDSIVSFCDQPDSFKEKQPFGHLDKKLDLHLYPFLTNIHAPINRTREARWEKTWDHFMTEHKVVPKIKDSDHSASGYHNALKPQLWADFFVEALMMQNIHAHEYVRIFCASIVADRVIEEDVTWEGRRTGSNNENTLIRCVRDRDWLDEFKRYLFPGDDPHKFLAFHQVYTLRRGT